MASTAADRMLANSDDIDWGGPSIEAGPCVANEGGRSWLWAVLDWDS